MNLDGYTAHFIASGESIFGYDASITASSTQAQIDNAFNKLKDQCYGHRAPILVANVSQNFISDYGYAFVKAIGDSSTGTPTMTDYKMNIGIFTPSNVMVLPVIYIDDPMTGLTVCRTRNDKVEENAPRPQESVAVTASLYNWYRTDGTQIGSGPITIAEAVNASGYFDDKDYEPPSTPLALNYLNWHIDPWNYSTGVMTFTARAETHIYVNVISKSGAYTGGEGYNTANPTSTSNNSYGGTTTVYPSLTGDGSTLTKVEVPITATTDVAESATDNAVSGSDVSGVIAVERYVHGSSGETETVYLPSDVIYYQTSDGKTYYFPDNDDSQNPIFIASVGLEAKVTTDLDKAGETMLKNADLPENAEATVLVGVETYKDGITDAEKAMLDDASKVTTAIDSTKEAASTIAAYTPDSSTEYKTDSDGKQYYTVEGDSTGTHVYTADNGDKYYYPDNDKSNTAIYIDSSTGEKYYYPDNDTSKPAIHIDSEDGHKYYYPDNDTTKDPVALTEIIYPTSVAEKDGLTNGEKALLSDADDVDKSIEDTASAVETAISNTSNVQNDVEITKTAREAIAAYTPDSSTSYQSDSDGEQYYTAEGDSTGTHVYTDSDTGDKYYYPDNDKSNTAIYIDSGTGDAYYYPDNDKSNTAIYTDSDTGDKYYYPDNNKDNTAIYIDSDTGEKYYYPNNDTSKPAVHIAEDGSRYYYPDNDTTKDPVALTEVTGNITYYNDSDGNKYYWVDSDGNPTVAGASGATKKYVVGVSTDVTAEVTVTCDDTRYEADAVNDYPKEYLDYVVNKVTSIFGDAATVPAQQISIDSYPDGNPGDTSREIRYRTFTYRLTGNTKYYYADGVKRIVFHVGTTDYYNVASSSSSIWEFFITMGNDYSGDLPAQVSVPYVRAKFYQIGNSSWIVWRGIRFAFSEETPTDEHQYGQRAIMNSAKVDETLARNFQMLLQTLNINNLKSSAPFSMSRNTLPVSNMILAETSTVDNDKYSGYYISLLSSQYMTTDRPLYILCTPPGYEFSDDDKVFSYIPTNYKLVDNEVPTKFTAMMMVNPYSAGVSYYFYTSYSLDTKAFININEVYFLKHAFPSFGIFDNDTTMFASVKNIGEVSFEVSTGKYSYSVLKLVSGYTGDIIYKFIPIPNDEVPTISTSSTIEMAVWNLSTVATRNPYTIKVYISYRTPIYYKYDKKHGFGFWYVYDTDNSNTLYNVQSTKDSDPDFTLDGMVVTTPRFYSRELS